MSNKAGVAARLSFAELEQHRLQFEQGGAQLVAVAHQSIGDAAESRTAAGAHYPILADRDRQLAKLYGVPPFLPSRPKHGNMPVSVFIIGQDGHIVWNSSTDAATTWPTSEVILARLPLAVARK